MARNTSGLTPVKPGQVLVKGPRGKTKLSLLLDGIKENSLLTVRKNACKSDVEKAFLVHLAARAFDKSDPASGQLLTNLLTRVYPVTKPTYPYIDVGIESTDTPADMSTKIMLAAGQGLIPVDVADLMMSMVKNKLIIDERSDLVGRLEMLEKQLSISVTADMMEADDNNGMAD